MAECQRIGAFKLWCWRRCLRVPWKAKRSNQSISKEIYTEYSLEGLLLKPKCQYFDHLMGTADSLERMLMLGKIEGRRRRGWQRMRWLDGITDSKEMNLGKLQKMVRDREAWSAAVHEDWESPIRLGDWKTSRRMRRRRNMERACLWSAHRQGWLNVNVRGTKTERSSQTPKSLLYTCKEMEACHEESDDWDYWYSP